MDSKNDPFFDPFFKTPNLGVQKPLSRIPPKSSLIWTLFLTPFFQNLKKGGPKMTPKMVIFGPFLTHFWTDFGPFLVQKWLKNDPQNGPLSSAERALLGLKTGPKNGPKMGSDFGPKSGSFLGPFGTPKMTPKTPDLALYLSPPRAYVFIRGNPIGTPNLGFGPNAI